MIAYNKYFRNVTIIRKFREVLSGKTTGHLLFIMFVLSFHNVRPILASSGLLRDNTLSLRQIWSWFIALNISLSSFALEPMTKLRFVVVL